MFEAIKFIMEKMEKAINSIEHFQHDEVSGAPMMQEINNQIPDQPRSFRSGTNSNYTGMTRLGWLDFLRFKGGKIREWLFKVEDFFLRLIILLMIWKWDYHRFTLMVRLQLGIKRLYNLNQDQICWVIGFNIAVDNWKIWRSSGWSYRRAENVTGDGWYYGIQREVWAHMI